MAVIDPAPAVARYLGSVLEERLLLRATTREARHVFITTGNARRFSQALHSLTDVRAEAEPVRWQGAGIATAAAV